MDERMIKVTVGALLHDIGKVVFRAGESSERHAISGRDFLRDKAGIKDKDRAFLSGMQAAVLPDSRNLQRKVKSS